VLPALFTPGQDASIAEGAIKQDAIVRDTIVNVEVLPSSQSAGVAEPIEAVTLVPGPSPSASLSSAVDPSDVISALPDIPQNADTAPSETTAPSEAPVAAPASVPDLVENTNPAVAPSPSGDDTAAVSAADPAPTDAIPQEEAKPATTVALPVEKPKPVVKPRPTAAKAARPPIRRQASVAIKTQSRGMFGGFFQSKPRPKTQRAAATR
jgi:hypothetical protein